MFTKLEQRSWLKIEVARGRNAQQCYQGLREACGESALPYSTVTRWIRAFRKGREVVSDESRPGRPAASAEQIAAVSNLLTTERRWTIREIAEEVNMSHTTVLHILKNQLHMRKIASRWVPHSLSGIEKWQRYDAARIHLERYTQEGDNFLRRIITIDETWARSYEPELKRQSNEWRHYGSPRKSKVRQTPTNVKVMIISVYDCEGVILTHAVPRGRTVNAQYYCHFWEHNVRPALRKKRKHFLQNPPIILHDNARCHVAGSVKKLFDRWGWEVLYHPPYSPDISPCDFDLFPKMKEPLRGIRFKTVPDILRALDRSVASFNTSGATNGILRLPHRWQRVIHNAGDYIEGL